MADKTAIERTDATWNPVIGCRRVDEGCRNCYAEVMAALEAVKAQTRYEVLTVIEKAKQELKAGKIPAGFNMRGVGFVEVMLLEFIARQIRDMKGSE